MGLTIITGANRGIGLALTTRLAARGDTVLAVCRKSSPTLDALGVEVTQGVDLSAAEAPAKLAGIVGERTVACLIHNAGILEWGDSLDALNVEGIERQFRVNALAPLAVTAALAGKLERGGKVALVTSRMGSIADNSSGGFYGYRMSKAALNMAGKSLAVDLRPQGVAVAILHPGMVKTDMVGPHGEVEPDEAARRLIARLDELTPASSGGFWHANGESLPW